MFSQSVKKKYLSKLYCVFCAYPSSIRGLDAFCTTFLHSCLFSTNLSSSFIASTVQPILNGIHSEEGEYIIDNEGMEERWRKYCEGLYKNGQESDATDCSTEMTENARSYEKEPPPLKSQVAIEQWVRSPTGKRWDQITYRSSTRETRYTGENASHRSICDTVGNRRMAGGLDGLHRRETILHVINGMGSHGDPSEN